MSMEPIYVPVTYIVAPFVGTIVVCVASYYLVKCLRSLNCMQVIPRNGTRNHSWRRIIVSARPWYCSVCECLLLNGIGVYCDCCGVCADPDCIQKANRSLICKGIATKDEPMVHHWVKGNLPLDVNCVVCQQECSMRPGLVDFQCCWCQRMAHRRCIKYLDTLCDLGPFASAIVPPWCVQIARMKSSLRRHNLLRSVKDPGWKEWSPLVVIANQKSGSSEGEALLSEFRRILNPAQVIDLAERTPKEALQWSVLLAPRPIRYLVAGGDGTVSWILTTSHKMDLDPPPYVIILPLGTGNDLSRVLGWGKVTPSNIDAVRILQHIQDATLSEIDRWCVHVSPRQLGIALPSKTYYMYNYFSIGVDAQVALDFHRTRASKFYLFSNRLFNKLLYVFFGTNQVVWANCKNMQDHLDLYLDGKLIKLPELESIVVLNIPSWGAGVDLWALSGDAATQSYKDGILEVLGIYSSFHIAQLQIGLSTPLRIGQARTVDVRLKATAPVQIDGEPWEQRPANVRIALVDQAAVMENRKRAPQSASNSPIRTLH